MRGTKKQREFRAVIALGILYIIIGMLGLKSEQKKIKTIVERKAALRAAREKRQTRKEAKAPF